MTNEGGPFFVAVTYRRQWLLASDIGRETLRQALRDASSRLEGSMRASTHPTWRQAVDTQRAV
jgi:hypothetical protein